MKSHIYLTAKKCSTCIGQVVYVNATNAFILLPVHSGYILSVKITREIRLSPG